MLYIYTYTYTYTYYIYIYICMYKVEVYIHSFTRTHTHTHTARSVTLCLFAISTTAATHDMSLPSVRYKQQQGHTQTRTHISRTIGTLLKRLT